MAAVRWTYAAFGERCRSLVGRVLQALGVRPGDRVAYIAPNTHAQLTSFYAVPQIGAVLVPINYRLVARRVRVPHRAQRRHGGVRRRRLPRRRRSAFARGCRTSGTSSRSIAPRDGWLDYESLRRASASPVFARPDDRRTAIC